MGSVLSRATYESSNIVPDECFGGIGKVMNGMCHTLYDKYPYSASIAISFELWKAIGDKKGGVEYYFFGGGTKHGGICFRLIDFPDTCGVVELLYTSFGDGNKWLTNVKLGEWKPKDDTNVRTSVHEWSALSLVDLSHSFADYFNNYHHIFNSCNQWKVSFVEYLKEKGPLKNDLPASLENMYEYSYSIGLSLRVYSKT